MEKLKQYVSRCWESWMLPQKRTALRAVSFLSAKKPIPLLKPLPGLIEKNAPSAIENGEFMTDVLATWVKKGFVAGPFESPPMEGFRGNPLMAAVQKTKVRPILNLSSPKGRSFNDAVNSWEIENLQMSTPRLFSDSVLKAGNNALMSKTDIQDAYKLIPNPVLEWKYYGFTWLGKFFVDTTTVFGSKTAPASFDPLPETLVNIVCSVKRIPKTWVHRQLDDVPVVSPLGSGLTESFAKTYAQICKDLKIPLAENCPNHEKAFGPSTYGTVLGIGFDTATLEWHISRDKADDLQDCVDVFLEKRACTLHDAQVLHGKLSSFAQMSDFLRGFRFNLTNFLRKFESEGTGKKLIPQVLKDDLWVWKKVINAARLGLPLTENLETPPLFPLEFVSDAAGAAFEWENGTCKNISAPGDRGVASIRYEGNRPTWVSLLRWPKHLLSRDKGRGGAFFGSKSATLETVGLILPFVTKPSELVGQYIVLGVDNLSVVYAWEKRYSKNDPETSLLIRVLHVIEAFLHCKIYVTHVRRLSTRMATLADCLSRESTTDQEVLVELAGAQVARPWGQLGRWLEHPLLDWNLPQKILDDVKLLCEK